MALDCVPIMRLWIGRTLQAAILGMCLDAHFTADLVFPGCLIPLDNGAIVLVSGSRNQKYRQ